MSLTTLSTMPPTRIKSPPEMTFPPRYHSLQTPSKQQNPILSPKCHQISTIKPPPNFNFPTITPSPPVQKSPTNLFHNQPQSPLLRLPLEIRLQIYHDILNIHQIFHAHLTPSPQSYSSTQPSGAEFHTSTALQPLGHSLPSTAILTTHSTSLYARRGKIPTALLRSCKLVYEETRTLPFERDEFSFINWFWSGVYASRQFAKGLREWQRESVRWVGVEVLTRDLVAGEGEMETDWQELCGLWRGVWGLRLGVKGRLGGGVTGDCRVLEGVERVDEIPQVASRFEEERGLLSVECEWVRKGLCQMKGLRWVEVEIEDKDFGKGAKVAFCMALEDVMNTGEKGWEGRTKVVFIEKVVGKEANVGGGNFVWFGGDPGEDD